MKGDDKILRNRQKARIATGIARHLQVHTAGVRATASVRPAQRTCGVPQIPGLMCRGSSEAAHTAAPPYNFAARTRRRDNIKVE